MRILAFLGLTVLVALVPVRADDPPPIDLAALLDQAERANPEVAAIDARARAALEAPAQLEALPDPTLSVSYTNDGLDGLTLGSSEFSNVTVGWEQAVPFKSVRTSAAGVARAEAEATRVSSDVSRARLRARVIGLYADVYRIDRTAEIVAESREILAAELATARVRYESGEGIQEELLRAQTEIRKLELVAEALARARGAVAIALGEALGRREPPALGRAIALPEGRLPDDRGSLAAAAEAGSPEVRQADARARQAEATVERARAQTKAEFSWLAAYQFRGGLDPMVMGGFGVRLPVWKGSKQARGVAQSEAELDATRLEREQTAVRAAAELQALVNDLDSSERSLRLYREAILPQDAATLDAARAAFSAGKAPMGLLLDDVRRRLDDRIEAETLAARRVQVLASLEAVTGEALLDISASERIP